MVMIAQICKYPKMNEFIFQNGEFYIHEISGNAIKKSTWLEKKKKTMDTNWAIKPYMRMY